MARITDRDFIERAVAAEFISEAQGEECLELARRLKDKGSPIPVREVLLDKGYLTEAQVRSVRYGGKVITLTCTTCGNACRVRGRRSTDSRKCPNCGGKLEEGDPSEGSKEPAKADAPPAQPAEGEPAVDEPEEEAGRDAVEDAGEQAEHLHERPASDHAPPQAPAPRASWVREVVLSRWVLTCVLAVACTFALRGLLMLMGIR